MRPQAAQKNAIHRCRPAAHQIPGLGQLLFRRLKTTNIFSFRGLLLGHRFGASRPAGPWSPFQNGGGGVWVTFGDDLRDEGGAVRVMPAIVHHYSLYRFVEEVLDQLGQQTQQAVWKKPPFRVTPV